MPIHHLRRLGAGLVAGVGFGGSGGPYAFDLTLDLTGTYSGSSASLAGELVGTGRTVNASCAVIGDPCGISAADVNTVVSMPGVDPSSLVTGDELFLTAASDPYDVVISGTPTNCSGLVAWIDGYVVADFDLTVT